jgi:hypothetical protein
MSDDVKKYLNALNTNYYLTLSNDELTEIQNKVDNFLEIAYLAPQQLDFETLNLLKARENKLTQIKSIYQLIGAVAFTAPYILYRRSIGFYFRNFCWTIIGSLAFGNFFGNIGEYFYNRKHFKLMIMKLALNYNISDEEIDELHATINKQTDSTKNENQNLDKIKIKI